MIDREKFEQWALAQPFFGYAAFDEHALERDGEGYTDSSVHGAWMGYCFALS